MPARATATLVRAWLPVVVWCAVIFAFSAVPSLGTGLGTWDLVLRKLAHVTEYAILAVLLVRACHKPPLALLLGVALLGLRRIPPDLRPRTRGAAP